MSVNPFVADVYRTILRDTGIFIPVIVNAVNT